MNQRKLCGKMKAVKFIIQALLMFILIFSAVEPTSAGLTVAFDPTTAHVGDTVTVIVTATNYGTSTWHPLKIYAPIPSGLKYMSHVVPDRVLQNYDPATGIWDVNRMSFDGRGQRKQLFITVKVLPSAEGKTLRATARFETRVIEDTGEDITNEAPHARHGTLRVLNINENENENGNGYGKGTGNGTGNGTGTGSGSGVGNGTGNSIGLKDSAGNTKLSNIMSNFINPDNKNNPLLNLQRGGGNGKAYEVVNATKNTPTSQDTSYAILAILVLIAFIAYGYYKEKKN
jgi:uncharacterized repeat protein (TIGR01451 family)